MKRTSDKITSFTRHYYQHKFDITDFLHTLLLNNQTNKSLITGMLDSNFSVGFKFACVNKGDIYKNKEFIIHPDTSSSTDFASFAGTPIDYVFSKLKEEFITGILMKEESLCEIHFGGFYLKPTKNMYDCLNLEQSVKQNTNRNFIIDMDMNDESRLWDTIGDILSREDVRNRKCQTSVDNIAKTYSKLISLQLCFFSNLMIHSIKMNDIHCLSPKNDVNVKASDKPHNIHAHTYMPFNKSLATLSSSLFKSKSHQDTFKIYFSGSKGIHVWFDVTDVNAESLKNALEKSVFSMNSICESVVDTVKWVHDSIIQNSEQLDTQKQTINFPEKITPFVNIIVEMVREFNIHRYTKTINEKLYMQQNTNEILQSLNSDELKKSMGFSEYSAILFKKMYYLWMASSSRTQKIDKTQLVTLEYLINELIIKKIFLNTKIANNRTDMLVFKDLIVGLLFFNPLITMDFGIYSKGHLIKMPCSINKSTNLTAFELKKWSTFKDINDVVFTNIINVYTAPWG